MNQKLKFFGAAASLATLCALGSGTVLAGPITITDLGDDCIAATCADLESAGYTVTGGGVVDPAGNLGGKYLTPGWDTFEEDNKTTSYNVTSLESQTQPEGAGTPIVITDLDGVFGFYWGSVDSYNIVKFYYKDELQHTIDGANLAAELGKSVSGRNYGFDVYVKFGGLFDKVELSSAGGAAFEVAAAVPEPGTLALLGLGLMGIGFARRRATGLN